MSKGTVQCYCMDCGSSGWGLSDSCISRVEVLNQEQFLLPSPPQPQDIWQCLETFFSEKAMAPHSSTLAWRVPWTEEPGGLRSMGSLSRTRLSDFTFTFHLHALEKEMPTHSSVLAWRIPRTGEPDGLWSMGSHRVGHN